MTKYFTERVLSLKTKLLSYQEAEERYVYIIELGKTAPPFLPEYKIAQNVVAGCQSILYLRTTHQDGKLFFSSYSEALISAGLAALLVAIYNDATPTTILLNPPTFLQEIGLLASLSPSRSNGLASIYLRMKQEALKVLNKETQ